MLNKRMGMIWNPQLISEVIKVNESGLYNFQELLIPHISSRIKLLRSCFIHKNGKKTTQEDFYHDASRISYIENGILRTERHKSFISSAIIYSILNNVINNEEYIRNTELARESDLPEVISAFWILFGNDENLEIFLYKVFFTVVVKYVDVPLNKEKFTQQEIELSKNLTSLLTLDAKFSLIYGQNRIKIISATNYDVPIKEESHNALEKQIRFTWDRISKQIIESYKKYILTLDKYMQKKFDSIDIDSGTFTWILEEFSDTILGIYNRISSDRIANLGRVVHTIMRNLEEKISMDYDLISEKDDNSFMDTLNHSNDEIMQLAIKLTSLQSTYLEEYFNSKEEENYDFDDFSDNVYY